jgi:hypothetical protein
MKKIKLIIVICTLAALLPVSKVPAQTLNQLTGYILTPTAGTLEETKFKIEAYSGMYAGTIASLDLGNMLGEFIGGLGASFLYGMSKNVEIGLNIESFNNIYQSGTINLPEINLNAKINFLPKYDDTGLGLGFQLINYNGSDTINLLPDLYVLWTTVIQDTVGLSLQVRPVTGFMVNTAIVVAPRNSTNLVLELFYHSGTFVILPELKIGTNDGLQLKIGSLFNVTSGIDIDNIGINISCGIRF